MVAPPLILPCPSINSCQLSIKLRDGQFCERNLYSQYITEYMMGARELFSQLNASHLSRDKRCLWQQTDLLKCYDSYVLYRTTATYCTSVIFTVYCRNVQRSFYYRLAFLPLHFLVQNVFCTPQSIIVPKKCVIIC